MLDRYGPKLDSADLVCTPTSIADAVETCSEGSEIKRADTTSALSK
jgi:hypothetical protein